MEKEVTMSKQTKFIDQISPAKRGWTAKIRVCEKQMPKISSTNSSRYQHLIFVDDKGTRIQATIFDKNIPRFEHTLKLFNKYYISKADVQPILKQYRIVDNNYQWILDANTEIQAISEENIADTSSTPCQMSFVAFDALHQYMKPQHEVDVIALAIEIKPTKELQLSRGSSKVREVTLIDENKKTMLLSLWNQYADNEGNTIASNISSTPIVAALHIKVSPYNYVSLSTKGSTCIITEPDFSEAANLRKWRTENQSYLTFIARERTEHASSLAVESRNIINIEELPDLMQQRDTFWIKVKISLTDFEQKFWYMACERCHKSAASEYNQLFDCDRCNRSNVKAIPRSLIRVELEDQSGIISATMFETIAEKFLHCSSIDLMEHTTEDGIPEIENFAQTSTGREKLIRIKGSRQNYTRTDYRYVVTQLLDASDAAI